MENPENTPGMPEEPEIPAEEALISEDVLEAKLESVTDSEVEEITPVDEETDVAPPIDEGPPAKEESRIRKFFRKLIRWTAGLLIIFGLGFVTAIFTIYNPIVSDLNQANSSLESADTEIADLDDQVDSLGSQIDTLTTKSTDLETRNQELLADQDTYELQIAVLTARVDIANAQIALYTDNPAQARIHLENTTESLKTIANLLPTDQKAVVNPLQSRLDLAIGEIDSDPETAIADLAILAGNLLELETSLMGE